MDQRVGLRRFIVAALIVAAALCGTLGSSSVASARETGPRDAKVSSFMSRSTGSSRAAPRVATAPERLAPVVRASQPARSSASPLGPVTRGTSSAAAGRTVAPKTVTLHFTPGVPLARYSLDGNAAFIQK